MRNVNIIHQVTDTTSESGSVPEPVLVPEMNEYLRTQGFVDVDASGDVSFTDDDDLIADLIVTAREILEEKLGCSLIAKTFTALLTNEGGMIQLPYGPVRSASAPTDAVLKGDFLQCPTGCNLTVTYATGYTEVPKAIVTELKRLVAYLYINRGDDPAVQPFVYQLAGKFNRKSWLA